jgi:hypothetical protein
MAITAKAEMKVTLTFTEDVLGTANNDPLLHDNFIASKAPDAKSREQEIADLGVEEVVERGMTVFPRMEDGKTPYLYDYQIKGFFKDSCGALRTVRGSESSKCKAYKKEIDKRIFVKERKIPFTLSGKMNECQRPLRAQTPQGERISIAHSETVPEGSSITFTIQMLIESDADMVREWLDYGALCGIGQWRNSGKGRFMWREESFTKN